ncbi:hypothetical protein MKY96_32510 [Paenibacillus sp. FSL R7-0302]|uniref:hypothetical protein n=1 Tax=Paenibacillus sp. FSL R7-0302 TaxID=2921681 RepID=UPI0030F771D5
MSNTAAAVEEFRYTEEDSKFLLMAEKFEQAMRDKQQQPKLDINKIAMSTHAYQKAEERFGLKDKHKATQYFKRLLEKAMYICESVDETGSRTHIYGVYAGNGFAVGMHINLEYTKIVTVIKHTVSNYPMPEGMRDKVMGMYKTELRKLCKKEMALLNKMDYISAQANAEIYPLKFEAMKTKSAKKLAAIEDRLNEVESFVESKREELVEIQNKIRYTARSLTCLL